MRILRWERSRQGGVESISRESRDAERQWNRKMSGNTKIEEPMRARVVLALARKLAEWDDVDFDDPKLGIGSAWFTDRAEELLEIIENQSHD